MMTDPNSIYDYVIVHATGEGGNIGETFADARDNPKYSKTVLMAAVLAGWQAAMALTGSDNGTT